MWLWAASGMTTVAQRRKGTCRKGISSRYRIFSLSNATWSAASCSLKAPKAANREVANALRLRSCAFAMKSSTVSPFTCWEIELKSWHVFTAKVEQQPRSIAFLARASRMKLMRSHWKSSAALITEPRSLSSSLKITRICKVSFFYSFLESFRNPRKTNQTCRLPSALGSMTLFLETTSQNHRLRGFQSRLQLSSHVAIHDSYLGFEGFCDVFSGNQIKV